MSSANLAVLAVLWAVVLWRLPAAWSSPWKRAPWMAFAALAVALTTDLPPVITWIDRTAGATDLAVLVKHLAMVVACTAVLDWVTSLSQPAAAPVRYLGLRHASGGLVVIALVVLWTVMPRHETTSFTETEHGALAGAYLGLFYVYLGAALGTAAGLFWRARRQAGMNGDVGGAGRRGLGPALLLLMTGSAVAAAYAACQFAVLAARAISPLPQASSDRVQTVAQLLENASIVLVLTGATLPAIAAGAQYASELASLRALRPLWHDLVAATPGVTAGPIPARPGFTRIWRHVHIRLIRRVGEIRDSSLRLSTVIGDGTVATARDRLAGCGLGGAALDAATEACWLRLAASAAACGSPPPANGKHLLPGGASLDDETALLRKIAAAYASPAVHDVVAQLTVLVSAGEEQPAFTPGRAAL